MWNELVARAEAERTVLSKHLDGKTLFTDILRLYAAIYREMTATLQSEQVEPQQEFREQKKRKRNLSDKEARP
jgi:SAM-dependent MidA family methyltransferase